MPVFSKESLAQLATLDPRLAIVLREAIKVIDFKVIEGHRGKAAQDAAYNAVPKRSHVKWPHGKHNKKPSLAVDIAPWPIDWNDTERFVLFCGVIIGIGAMMGVRLRWGGDWDRDWQVKDEKFRDYGHLELAD